MTLRPAGYVGVTEGSVIWRSINGHRRSIKEPAEGNDLGNRADQSFGTTRSFGRFSSALRIAACRFPGRSSKVSASSSASWTSRRCISLAGRRG